MRIATRTSLTGTGNGCMTSGCKQTDPLLCNLRNEVAVICPQVSLEENSDLHGCFNERELSSDRRRPSLSVEDKSYSASFHLSANEWLAFWLFLVASSYVFLSKNVRLFPSCRIEPAKKVSLPERTIPNAGAENDETAVNSPFSCSESSGSSQSFSSKNSFTRLCTKCDSSSEISDLDRASYWDSLLRLEEEDSEWLSDSTPLSSKCYSFTDISDIDTASYWDSLLNLEGKDCEWISDSKPEFEYFRDGFPSPSYKGSWGTEVLPSVSTISSLTGVHCNRSEDTISAEHLLETADMEEVSADVPLFWPFEGEFNWDSEESWSSFSTSPRRRLVFDSISTTSRIKEFKQEGNEAVSSVKSETSSLSLWSKSSAKIVTKSKDEKVVLERGEVPSNKLLSLSKTFLNEDFASNKDLPLGREDFALDQELPIETLVGLKEFDGHEGIDSDFNGDVFMLDESI